MSSMQLLRPITPWLLTASFVLCGAACSTDDDDDGDEEAPITWEYAAPYADGDEVDWVVRTEAIFARLPAVDAESGLVFGDWNGVLRRVDSDTGEVSWTFDGGARIDAAPAIDEEGRIYFGTWAGDIYAVDGDGGELWRHNVEAIVDASPSIDELGRIWIGDDAGFLHILSDEGEVEETFDLEAPVTSAASIFVEDEERTVYVATADRQVHCRVGSEDFESLELPGEVGFDLALTEGGDAVATTDNGTVARIAPDCTIVWEEDATWATLMPAALSPAGHVWVPTHNRQVYRFDLESGTNDAQMSGPIRANATTAPTIDDDGRALVSTRGVVFFEESQASGTLSAVDAMDSPVLIDGAAFVTTEQGALLRLTGEWPAMAQSSWPTQHGNLARNGRFTR